jgi:SPP1 gp7 family putative phage head morphogenesis protein
VHAGDITADTLAADLLLATGAALWSASEDGLSKRIADSALDTPDFLRLQQYRYNTYVFAAFKNHLNVKEMAELLVDGKGKVRSFEKYREAVKPLMDQYNGPWLRAEYNSAIASGQMAASWERIQADAELFPFILYRTAGDGRVRDEHRALDGMSQPVDSPIWDKWFPPNGWNCRCTVSQTAGPAQDAKDMPEPAKGFDFNPGKSLAPFAESHPYFQGMSEDQRSRVIEALRTAADEIENFIPPS